MSPFRKIAATLVLALAATGIAFAQEKPSPAASETEKKDVEYLVDVVKTLLENHARLLELADQSPGERMEEDLGRVLRDTEALAVQVAQRFGKSADPKVRGLADKIADLGRRIAADRAKIEESMGASRAGAHEASAIGALRTITTAQALYREGDKDKNDVLDYAPSLADLAAVQLIDAALGSGRKMGYDFRILGADQFTWRAVAVPVEPGKSGTRSFFIDESGVIRYSADGTEANEKSNPIGG